MPKFKTYFVYGLMIFLFVIQTSCIKVPLKKELEIFNPYSNGDVLVFKSQKKNIHDTLYIYRISKWYYDGVVPLFSKNYQGLSVDTHIPHYWGQNKSLYSTDIFLIVPKEKIGFDLTINNNVKFYSTQSIDIKSEFYKSIRSIKIGNRTYNDVIVIDSNSPYLNERKNEALKAYWSLSEGYVGLEMKDGELYELISKYKDVAKCNALRNRPKLTDKD